MADVTGRIGTESVELNNAATEATLRQLLAVTMAANKGAADQIKGLAAKSGLQVDDANQGLQAVAGNTIKSAGIFKSLYVTTGLASEQLRQWGSAFTPFISSLVNGTAKTSSTLEMLGGIAGRLHPALGMMLAGVTAVAKVQEENLAAYRKIAAGGVNFAGDLMGMRNSFAQAGLTLAEGTAVIEKNREAFASMGGTAEQGATQFFKLAKELRTGEFGHQIRALGLTGEQAANGLASYIAMSGPRSREEMRNTAALTKGAAEYLSQLDRLAQITGKSREELEANLKKAQQNSAWQAMLAGMDEKAKKASTAALNEMVNKYGEAGADLYQSTMMGIPPQTEAGKALASLAPEVYEVVQRMTEASKAGADQATIMRLSAEATAAGSEAARRFGQETLAVAATGAGPVNQALQSLQRTLVQAEKTQTDTVEGGVKRDAEIAQNVENRNKSMASSMAEAENNIKNASASLLSIFTPAINAITPYLEKFTGLIDKAISGFEKLDPSTQKLIGLGTGAVALGAALFATGGIAKRILGIGQLGSSIRNPLFVTPAGGAGAGGLAESLGKGKKPPGPTGTASGTAAGAGGKTAGAAAGSAAGSAAKGGLLKGFGKLLPGAGLAFGAYDAYERFKGGDLLGAGFAGASALASLIPGVGTAAAVALTAANVARDIAKDNKDENSPNEASEQAANVAATSAERERSHEELLITEVQRLNTYMAEMLRHMRDTAEYTRKNNDAIKGLSGNLFPVP